MRERVLVRGCRLWYKIAATKSEKFKVWWISCPEVAFIMVIGVTTHLYIVLPPGDKVTLSM